MKATDVRTTPTLVICPVAAAGFAVALALPSTFLATPAGEDRYGTTDGDAAAGLTIADFTFGTTTATAGTTVTVSNTDNVDHTVTGDGFDVTIVGNETQRFTAPRSPGSYPFRCRIHPSMTGVLTVTD